MRSASTEVLRCLTRNGLNLLHALLNKHWLRFTINFSNNYNFINSAYIISSFLQSIFQYRLAISLEKYSAQFVIIISFHEYASLEFTII